MEKKDNSYRHIHADLFFKTPCKIYKKETTKIRNLTLLPILHVYAYIYLSEQKLQDKYG